MTAPANVHARGSCLANVPMVMRIRQIDVDGVFRNGADYIVGMLSRVHDVLSNPQEDFEEVGDSLMQIITTLRDIVLGLLGKLGILTDKVDNKSRQLRYYQHLYQSTQDILLHNVRNQQQLRFNVDTSRDAIANTTGELQQSFKEELETEKRILAELKEQHAKDKAAACEATKALRKTMEKATQVLKAELEVAVLESQRKEIALQQAAADLKLQEQRAKEESEKAKATIDDLKEKQRQAKQLATAKQQSLEKELSVARKDLREEKQRKGTKAAQKLEEVEKELESVKFQKQQKENELENANTELKAKLANATTVLEKERGEWRDEREKWKKEKKEKESETKTARKGMKAELEIQQKKLQVEIGRLRDEVEEKEREIHDLKAAAKLPRSQAEEKLQKEIQLLEIQAKAQKLVQTGEQRQMGLAATDIRTVAILACQLHQHLCSLGVEPCVQPQRVELFTKKIGYMEELGRTQTVRNSVTAFNRRNPPTDVDLRRREMKEKELALQQKEVELNKKERELNRQQGDLEKRLKEMGLGDDDDPIQPNVNVEGGPQVQPHDKAVAHITTSATGLATAAPNPDDPNPSGAATTQAMDEDKKKDQDKEKESKTDSPKGDDKKRK